MERPSGADLILISALTLPGGKGRVRFAPRESYTIVTSGPLVLTSARENRLASLVPTKASVGNAISSMPARAAGVAMTVPVANDDNQTRPPVSRSNPISVPFNRTKTVLAALGFTTDAAQCSTFITRIKVSSYSNDDVKQSSGNISIAGHRQVYNVRAGG